MANLSGKTSDGKLSFEKYISNNPKWHSLMEFTVEKGVSGVPIVDIKANTITETKNIVSEGDKLVIMSKVYKTVKKKRYTKIKIVGSRTVQGELNYATTGIQGYLDLRFIRKPTGTDVMKAEHAAIRDLDSAIRKIEVPVTIIVNKTKETKKQFIVKDIIEARKIGGTPKADLALFDKYGVPVFWISHKKEGGASAFQQYSGISERSGAAIYQHKECKQFMRKVIKYLEGGHEYEKEMEKATEIIIDLIKFKKEKEVEYGNINTRKRKLKEELKSKGKLDEGEKKRTEEALAELEASQVIDHKEQVEKILRKNQLLHAARQLSDMNQSKYLMFLKNPVFDEGEIINSTSKLSTPLWSKIKDPLLRRMAIYGPDVKFTHKFGQNNVQMIGQGNPILEPIGFEDTATLRLSFSNSYKTNEDISGFGGDYEPVFVATYRAGRGFSVDNKSYMGARLGIAPYAMVKNRKGIKKVE